VLSEAAVSEVVPPRDDPARPLGDKPERRLATYLGIADMTLRHWIKEGKPARGERSGQAFAL
jgi:hypothetical protein